MPVHLIQTKEYECIRCGYMWIGRKAGREKYMKGQEPKYCPKCKTYLWNTDRVYDPTTLYRNNGKLPRPRVKRWNDR